MKTITTATATTTANTAINIAADLFIVPNNPGRLGDLFDVARSRLKWVGNGNNFDDDYVVEVWLCNEFCENMVDHYFKVVDQEGRAYMTRLPTPLVPATMLWGLGEGDTIPITYTVLARTEDGEDVELRLTIMATAAQRKYRYRRYGDFDKVLKDLLPLKYRRKLTAATAEF